MNVNIESNRRPYLKIAILAVAVALVALLVVRQVRHFGGGKEEVWVAATALAPGQTVKDDDLVRRTVRADRIPAGAVLDPGDLEGRTLARGKQPGQAFFNADFAPDPGEFHSLAEMVPEGRVLVSVRLDSRRFPVKKMARGDRVAVIASERGVGGLASRVVTRDAEFIGWVGNPNPPQQRPRNPLFASIPQRSTSAGTMLSVYLAVPPEDAVPISQAQAAGLALMPVVRGRVEGEDLELMPGGRGSVELISGDTREQVPLTH